MQKTKKQEEIQFSIPEETKMEFDNSFQILELKESNDNKLRLHIFLSTIFLSYFLLSFINIIIFSSDALFPAIFSVIMAIVLRGIIGPIDISNSDLEEIINNTIKDPLEVVSSSPTQSISNLIETPLNAVSSQETHSSIPLILEDDPEPIIKNPVSENDLENNSSINEYFQLLKNTYEEDKEIFENKEYPKEQSESISQEDQFLKRLNEVQLLLKAKQDKLKNFKKEHQLSPKITSYKKKKLKLRLESFTERLLSFSCQACNKNFQGTIKKVNGSIFVEHKNEELILQSNKSGYSFLYEHTLENTIVHQTFINLSKDFVLLSSEVFISMSGIKKVKLEEDVPKIAENEKFIPRLKYLCSICNKDYPVKTFTKIKYESANQSTFIHIQTQHNNGDQQHLATLRIDLLDKMLVAIPNVQIIATLPNNDNNTEEVPV